MLKVPHSLPRRQPDSIEDADLCAVRTSVFGHADHPP